MATRIGRRRSGPKRADAIQRASKVLDVLADWLEGEHGLSGGLEAFINADLGVVSVVNRTQNGCQIVVEKQNENLDTEETAWFDIRVSFVTSERN